MPTRWEYQWKSYHLDKTETGSNSWYIGDQPHTVRMGEDLDQHGSDGWELVSLIVEDRDSGGSATRLTAVLKRPLSS
jgi:hypothetical protein